MCQLFSLIQILCFSAEIVNSSQIQIDSHDINISSERSEVSDSEGALSEEVLIRVQFKHSKKIKMNKFWIAILLMFVVASLVIDDRYVFNTLSLFD